MNVLESSAEQLRINALKEYYILDTMQEAEFDRVTELASIICETPISLISLLDDKRQWFKSKKGIAAPETPVELAFCKYTIEKDQLFQVHDATADARFMHNSFVTGDPHVKFYAGFPLIDPNGFALGSLCVIDKIPRTLTEMQERSLQLLAGEVMDRIVKRREREELRNFQKLFNLSDDLLCIAGYDGYFKKVNPAFMRLLGYNEKYLLETSYYDLLHPDDLVSTANEKEKLSEGETSYNFINRYRTKDGSYKTIQWITSPEKLQPNLYAIGRDISKQVVQKKELERTREILEQTNKVAQVGGWELNLAKNSLYWTSVTKQIHEVDADYTPDLQSGIYFYKEGKDRELIAEAVNKAINFGEQFDLELNINTAKGKMLWVRTKGKAESENGKVKRLFGTFQDIDKQKKASLALEQSTSIIQQQNDRLVNFAHIVSHNLRNHTGNLKMLLELMDEEPDPEIKFSYINPITSVSESLNETIDNLNEVVQVQTNKTLSKSKVSLETNFNTAVKTLSGIIQKENATVTGNFEAVNEIEYVPAYIESIMLNFISNSIKYKHPSRKPVVNVVSSVKEGRHQITYSDNGIGIDLKKNGDKIFGLYNTFHTHPDARGEGNFVLTAFIIPFKLFSLFFSANQG